MATNRVNKSREPSRKCRWKVGCVHLSGGLLFLFLRLYLTFLLFYVVFVSDTIVSPKRRGRGQTRGLSLQMKRHMSADGKLDVLIHPTKLVAVGPGRNDFITDLSLIVRRNARLNVRQWKKVPQSTRDTIVQNILVCYDIGCVWFNHDL